MKAKYRIYFREHNETIVFYNINKNEKPGEETKIAAITLIKLNKTYLYI